MVWGGGLILLVVGVALAWRPILANLRQVQGLKGLLASGEWLSAEDMQNPFICLRPPGNPAIAMRAVQQLSDPYLQAVGLCLAGERQAGLARLEQAGRRGGAAVQLAVSQYAGDAETQVEALDSLGMADYELSPVLRDMLALPGMDALPVLRKLAAIAPAEPLTWYEWIWAIERLEREKQWQEAMDLALDGLDLAPRQVQSSLYRQIGRIYQIRQASPDLQMALKYYDQAFELGGWLNSYDEAVTHLFRGDVYRALKEQFTPQQALAEFEAALKTLPGNYWALLGMGHVYFYDVQDYQMAEDYYHQALAGDSKQPYAYYYLGEVFRARGDKIAALEWYRQALSKQADFQAAIDRLAELEGK